MGDILSDMRIRSIYIAVIAGVVITSNATAKSDDWHGKPSAIVVTAADNSDKKAQLELGKRYESGTGVEVDTSRAARLYGAAARSTSKQTFIYSPASQLGGAGRVVSIQDPQGDPGLPEAAQRLLSLQQRTVRQKEKIVQSNDVAARSNDSVAAIAATKFGSSVNYPVTRSFGNAEYSEKICATSKQEFCAGKETTVSVSIYPLRIFDMGDELHIIYNSSGCAIRTFTSYKEISSKSKISQVVSGIYCRDQEAESNYPVGYIDDLYAATQHMKRRAEFVFGPISGRCVVKRSKSGYPLSTNCPQK